MLTIEALARYERLRSKWVPCDDLLDHISAQAARIAALEAAIEACDRAMTALTADDEFVTLYQVLAGPWHRVLAVARGAGPGG